MDIYNNLNEREFKISYWLATHRVTLRRIMVGVLGLTAGGFILYSLLGLINYYSGAPGVDNLIKEMADGRLNYALIAEASQPRDLQIKSVRVVASDGEGYDFVAEIFNPNAQWKVETFDFHFVYGAGGTTASGAEFILPGQTKYAIVFREKTGAAVSSAQVVLENIRWRKVANYQELSEKFLRFEFQNVRVTPSQRSGLSDKEDIANVSFDILNGSAYNFAEPKFTILLFRGDNLVGVSQLVLDKIASGERASQSLNFFQKVGDGAKAVVAPDIDVLDANSFAGFDYGSGELK